MESFAFGFLVGDVIIGVHLRFLAQANWAPTPRDNYLLLVSIFNTNVAKICIFRALDWPSSACGSNVMAKNKILAKIQIKIICGK